MSVRHTRGETGPPTQSRARATYYSVISVELLLSASESAAAPASPIWLIPRLQREEEGQVCSWRDRVAGAKQGARNLPDLRQRRVALERLRERRDACVADLVVPQAAARGGGSGMLVAGQGRRHRAGRARLTTATSASRCSREPRIAPRRPRRRCCRGPGCSENRRVRDARGETGPPEQSKARATYLSDVSKPNASASLSLFLPLLSSRSTTALASIFAPPLTLLQTSAS
jgi:hypothetical protein